jgi:hypothetical protein
MKLYGLKKNGDEILLYDNIKAKNYVRVEFPEKILIGLRFYNNGTKNVHLHIISLSCFY